MSRDSNERGHVSQRYQYETLPIPHANPMPPIPPMPKPYRAACQIQYPPTDTPPSPPSILSLTASTALSSSPPFTIHNIPGPCHKYLNSNVNVKPTGAVLCTWVTSSIPASTSTYDNQAQRDIAFVNVNNDFCKTLPSS
ncbi:hypothetical protein M378DRAFT_11272 [Amanita muscaria Koide BX008]|uniref:Uncharacterized protein n=1 Tax=Amanita muscaria (strain Koide BX008) TaxID=946122 RepID=A0A0C2WSM4_AMAMK|nr:hypothetical protein M378DRAFT_11272 [Amanita muscaria Koide BX008]